MGAPCSNLAQATLTPRRVYGRETLLSSDPPHLAVVQPGLLTGLHLFDFAAGMDSDSTAGYAAKRLSPVLKRERSTADLYDHPRRKRARGDEIE